jgi:hypothetical protein
MSRLVLDQESQPQHGFDASLDIREILNIFFKKFVSTVKKSWSSLRLLDLVSTPPSRPKSLDQDQEIIIFPNILVEISQYT